MIGRDRQAEKQQRARTINNGRERPTGRETAEGKNDKQ